MDSWWSLLYILICFLSIVPLCHCQNDISITQPQLLSITPVNSTDLIITWIFANSTYDQSNFIQISIQFYEFYYNYGPINTSINYTFLPENKTITSLIQHFELVNAFYYVCFLSNSTYTNLSISVSRQICQVKRTCLRSNSSICPQAPFVIISNTGISSNSFIIIVNWLNNLPYLRNMTMVQLSNSGTIGTSLSSTENDTYISLPYQFSNLQSNTNYTINIIVNYIIFGNSLTDTINYYVLTSCSSNLLHTGNSFSFIVCSIFLSFVFL